MNAKILIVALLFSSVAHGQSAQGEQPADPKLNSVAPDTRGNNRPIQLADLHWTFLGCAYSYDQCRDAAGHQGFHHYRVERNHDACEHEPHLMCFGAH